MAKFIASFLALSYIFMAYFEWYILQGLSSAPPSIYINHESQHIHMHDVDI